jgi:hypothetical protein
MLPERLVKIGISFWLEADETGILFQDFAGFFYLFHSHPFGFHLIIGSTNRNEDSAIFSRPFH